MGIREQYKNRISPHVEATRDHWDEEERGWISSIYVTKKTVRMYQELLRARLLDAVKNEFYESGSIDVDIMLDVIKEVFLERLSSYPRLNETRDVLILEIERLLPKLLDDRRRLAEAHTEQTEAPSKVHSSHESPGSEIPAMPDPLNASLPPIMWNSEKSILVWIVKCLRKAGLIVSTDSLVLKHFRTTDERDSTIKGSGSQALAARRTRIPKEVAVVLEKTGTELIRLSKCVYLSDFKNLK